MMPFENVIQDRWEDEKYEYIDLYLPRKLTEQEERYGMSDEEKIGCLFKPKEGGKWKWYCEQSKQVGECQMGHNVTSGIADLWSHLKEYETAQKYGRRREETASNIQKALAS